VQAGIPFATVYDRHLADLSRLKVLVLANQDALSGEQVERIERFVAGGGSVVATEATSALNEWRQRRPRPALAELLGLDSGVRPVRAQRGRGRVAYVPRVEPAVAPPPPQLYYVFRNEFWKLPRNHAELVDAVRWAMNRPEFAASVPQWVAVETGRRPGAFVAHLVNYKVGAPVLGAELRLRAPGGGIKSAVAESPDWAEPLPLPIARTGDTVAVKLPRLDIYAAVVFRQ
jgi:hypothetical protein